MFAWLASNTLAAAALALVALAAERALRRFPGVVHLLWLAVLVRLVLPPLPFGTASVTDPAAGVLLASGPPWAESLVAGLTRLLGSRWSIQALQALLVLFAAAAVLCVGREIRRLVRFRRGLADARDPEPEVLELARRAARSLGVSRPRVRRTAAVRTPCVLGLQRPVLLLPAESGGPSEAVIAHELAHLRRGDHLAGWLDLLVLALHFWNPLYWLARRRLALAAEWACDAWALFGREAERGSYATALVDAVERTSFGALSPSTLRAVGVGAGELEERLSRILAGRDRPRAPRWAAALVGLLLVVSAPGLVAPTLASFRAALPAMPRGLDRSTWERLLERGDALLAADPDDGRGHASRGMGLLGLGRADEAAAAFERQAELGFEPAKAHYNAACAHARAGRAEPALAHLEAAAAGVPVAELVPRDPDLASLRGHPRVLALGPASGTP